MYIINFCLFNLDDEVNNYIINKLYNNVRFLWEDVIETGVPGKTPMLLSRIRPYLLTL